MDMASSNFLIPNATFFVELIAFLVVLAIIGRYVLPFLNKALDARAEGVRAELAAADEAKADAEGAEHDRRAALENARREAREIVAQANRTAERVATDAQARGQAEYERLVTNGEAEVRLARQRAVEEASSRLGELVMDVVERVIGREVDPAAHRDLIDEAVAALESDMGSEEASAAASGGHP
jgi:F-type H+-transporting ATPase subunit b